MFARSLRLRHLLERPDARLGTSGAPGRVCEAALRERVEEREDRRPSGTKAAQSNGGIREDLLAELFGSLTAAGPAQKETVDLRVVGLERLLGQVRWLSPVVHSARSDPRSPLYYLRCPLSSPTAAPDGADTFSQHRRSP